MWLSVNLLGMFVRGLFSDPSLESLKSGGSDFVKNEIEGFRRAESRVTLVSLLLISGYLFATFYFWNIGVTIVVISLMLARLPDLLWEIKTGQELNRVASALSMPKNALYYIASFLTYASLPALYYSLYFFGQS